jgi:threonine/homoserine/homoserine lactone efflux protein
MELLLTAPDPQRWLAFVLAAAVILVIPGPTLILIISQALAHGRRSVLPLVTGTMAGDLVAVTLSLAGLGAVMAASATLFSLLKWGGALYLVFLGIRLWRTRPQPFAPPEDRQGAATSRLLFRRAFTVTALNPKSIAFFVAFLPQFVDPTASPGGQLVLLGATFLVLAFTIASGYALTAGHLRELFDGVAARKRLNRLGGGVLVGAGIMMAAMRQNS